MVLLDFRKQKAERGRVRIAAMIAARTEAPRSKLKQNKSQQAAAGYRYKYKVIGDGDEDEDRKIED